MLLQGCHWTAHAGWAGQETAHLYPFRELQEAFRASYGTELPLDFRRQKAEGKLEFFEGLDITIDGGNNGGRPERSGGSGDFVGAPHGHIS